MKYYTPLLLAASLFSAAPALVVAQPAAAPVAAAEPQDDLYKSVQENLRGRKYSEVVEQAEQALKIEGLSEKDKVRFLNAAASASSRLSQHEQAQEFYEKIVADPAIANSSKIAALKGVSDAYIGTLAGQYLEKMNLAPAYNALNRALELPDLKPEERANALKNIGALYEQEDNYDQAISTYEKIIALNVREQTKTAAWKMIADAHAGSGRADKAIAIYQDKGLDLLKLYNQLGETDKAVAIAVEILDDAAATDKDRWAAYIGLPYWGRSNHQSVVKENLAGIRTVSEKYLPAFMKEDPDRALRLLSIVKNDKLVPVFRNSYYDRDLANPDFIVWAVPILLQAPKLSDKDYALVIRKYTNALMVQGDVKKATAELQNVVKDERADGGTRFWAQLTLASLSGKAADIDNVIKQEKILPEKEKSQEVINAGQTVLASDNNQAARQLYSAYEKLFVQLPTATITCSFTPNAPFDVGSWLNSPLLKDAKSTVKLDRPYGDNLQLLLETDASSERDAAAAPEKETGDTDTNFHIVSDAQGIHLFFDAVDARAQEVLDGLLRGGSFEMYLAPGKNQAYYTFLPGFPRSNITTGPESFVTMYPNPGFRLPSTEDGTLRSSIAPTKNGFGLSVFLSWQLFYDKLPSNGDKWQFEAIRWTRAGGLSFAGSQSVHNRSSWGDIVFSDLTPQNLNAIKRSILLSAVTKYRAAKGVAGPVGRWEDAELGDPAFYQAKVAPLLANLDRYAAMVNKEMTAADVEKIFAEAVPGWMEIEHNVAALRAQYLREKQLSR